MDRISAKSDSQNGNYIPFSRAPNHQRLALPLFAKYRHTFSGGPTPTNTVFNTFSTVSGISSGSLCSTGLPRLVLFFGLSSFLSLKIYDLSCFKVHDAFLPEHSASTTHTDFSDTLAFIWAIALCLPLPVILSTRLSQPIGGPGTFPRGLGPRHYALSHSA